MVRSRSRSRRWRPSRTRFSHRPPASTGCKSSGSPVANQWSVQNNMNDWTIASGDQRRRQAATQFTIQSERKSRAASASGTSTCTSAELPQHVLSTDRRLSDPAACRRSIWATSRRRPPTARCRWSPLSWVPTGQPNQYAVVPRIRSSMAGNWTQVERRPDRPGGLLAGAVHQRGGRHPGRRPRPARATPTRPALPARRRRFSRTRAPSSARSARLRRTT